MKPKPPRDLATAFAESLADDDRAPRTIAGYSRDLAQFARWFEQTNGRALSPQILTPTDARHYRQHLLHVEKAAPATTLAPTAPRSGHSAVSTADWQRCGLTPRGRSRKN